MGKFYQYVTAIAASFGSLAMGLLNVWPSYTQILYTNETLTPLNEAMSAPEISLLGSLPSLGAMLGTAVVGLLMQKFGRKRAGIIISLPFVLSWAIISATTNPLVVLIARFISGAGGGAFLVFGPIFISEVAENSIRGTLASGPVAFYCLGVLFSYLLGWFQTYKTILYVNIAASVFCLMLQALVAESPVYLLNNGKEEEARASIAHYRGMSVASKPVLEELSRLKQQITPSVELVPSEDPDVDQKAAKAEEEKLNQEDVEYYRQAMTLTWRAILGLWIAQMWTKARTAVSNPTFLRGMLIVATTLSMQVFMGMVAVQVNAEFLFTLAAPDLSPNLCSVLLAVVLLCGSAVTATLADRAGRKLLLISSSVIVAICMAGLGVILHAHLHLNALTAALLLLYCFAFNYGAGSVPYILLSEMFVPEFQSFASVVLVEWVWLCNFLIIAVFQELVNIIQLHGVFYLFACVGLSNAVFAFFVLPETKGMSVDQIQELLRRGR